MRHSKYPSLGILEAFENYVSGGITRERIAQKVKQQNARDFSPRLFSRQLFGFKTRGLISQKNDGTFVLEDKGKEFLAIESLTKIVLQNKKRDGYRRLIIFDVPEQRRDARDMLRAKLKEFECQQLQKSVYITPYVCEDEIREVAKILSIGSYIHIMKVIPL